ncbi:MAG: glycoside hydrolase family 43 protein [Opitutales bacterium]|nr:glycoside hydrolase family 43 protein [Opitutales bacterium]
MPAQVTTLSARGPSFTNPVVSGFSPDPSICRVGDDFYMVCSSFEYFPGVPVYHSKDLVNWELISYCLTTPTQLPLGNCRSSSGIYAPALRYHDGLFYMITTNFAEGGEFYVTATDPKGPWSEPVWLHSNCADPSLLFDDDGKTYVVHPAGGGGAHSGMIYLMELDLEKGAYKEGQTLPGKLIWTGTGGQYPEGPHLRKVNGRYYLMIAEGGTGGDHRETIAVSDSPWGPYIPFENNPILTHRDLPDYPISSVGHADMVQLKDGSWWGVSLGVRPHNGVSPLGRETFLMPVEWTADGWPIMGEKRRVLMEGPGPALERQPWPVPPVREDFSSESLDLEWNYVRNPDPSRYTLKERKGWLRLKGAAATLNDLSAQTALLRRQRHFDMRISTMMDFRPAHDGEEAGLVLRQTDALHADFCVLREKGVRSLVLRLVEPKQKTELYRAALPEGKVELSIVADRDSYRFLWKGADGTAAEAGSIPGEKLAFEASWSGGGVMNFAGMMMGVYATGNGRDASAPADFDWFDYEPLHPDEASSKR